MHTQTIPVHESGNNDYKPRDRLKKKQFSSLGHLKDESLQNINFGWPNKVETKNAVSATRYKSILQFT